MPGSAGIHESNHSDAENDHHLQRSEEQLKFPGAFYADVIQDGNEDDGTDRDELAVRDGDRLLNDNLRQECEGSERPKYSYETGHDGGYRSRLGDQEVRPSVEESAEWTVGVTDVNIFASGLRLHRA